MRFAKYLFVVSTLFVVGSAESRAQTVCTAADIAAQEASCPAAGICSITKTYTVANACVLDFGARDVVMTATGRLNIGSGSVTLNALSLTLQASAASTAFIDGRGQGASPPLSNGGSIQINVTNGFLMSRNGATRSRIDLSANNQAGSVQVVAGGVVSIMGRINADQTTETGAGGKIDITAGGNLTTDSQSLLSATGGDMALTGGGEIDLHAGGNLDLGNGPSLDDGIDVSGSNGGTVCMFASGDVIMRGLRGNANGESGSAGTVSIEAGHNVQILGQMLLRGGELDPTAGGDGGAVSICADFGNLTFGTGAAIFAEGSSPDGDGGEIDISVTGGSVTVMSGATISARSNGGQGVGGSIDLEVDNSITTAALLDIAGGSMGGGICVDASGPVTLGGGIDARGYDAGGAGGDIEVTAGLDGLGTLTILDNITASGGPCGIEEGCGDGGTTTLSGCDVTITSTGQVIARAPGSGGSHLITAREQLRVDGVISAAKLAAGTDGSIAIVHRSVKPPVIRNGGAVPAPMFSPMDTCSATVTANCLPPCPVCGNGIVEYPEQCDGGNNANCDGCSSFCQFESCAPGVPCVTCDAQLGCPSCPGVPTGTPTVTLTGQPTLTETPTRTPTPTRTTTNTHTETPLATFTNPPETETPTASETPTVTLTASPTETPTPEPSNTPTATTIPSATETATPTPSATTSPTETPQPTETPEPTVPPTCTGDCNGDGEVTIDELLTMVNIALETVPPSACPPGDANGDGEVTIDEILAAVNNALNSCV